MVEVTLKEMLEAGAHFGHQTRHWNPAMKPYIYGARNGIHIIDLQKTLPLCQEACQFVAQLVGEGGDILFVGTKKQAEAIVADEAKRCHMFYVSRRWLGGTLTNYRTIRASIDRLKDLEKKRDEGRLEGLTKKEKLGVEKEIKKLTQSLGGIKEMTRLPVAVFLVDPQYERIALNEANRLGVPVVALADTNCNPVGVDHLIPGNDDAIKSVRLFCKKIADACLEGLAHRAEMTRAKVAEGEEPGEVEPAVSKETIVEAKGKAYVSKPESYENEVQGEFTQKQAEGERKE